MKYTTVGFVNALAYNFLLGIYFFSLSITSSPRTSPLSKIEI
jgi:hypothetical protein